MSLKVFMSSKKANEAWMTSCLRREIPPPTMASNNPTFFNFKDIWIHIEPLYLRTICSVNTILDSVLGSCCCFFFSLFSLFLCSCISQLNHFPRFCIVFRSPKVPPNCKSFQVRDVICGVVDSPQLSTLWMLLLNLVLQGTDLRPRGLQAGAVPRTAL